MLRVTFFSIFIFFSSFVFGQDPVHWNFSVEPLGGDEYHLVFHAKIDKTWAVYSQFVEEDGPVPTSFEFAKAPHYKLIGKAEESGHKKSGFDKVFKMNITKFVDDGFFKQKVKVTDRSKPIEGYLTFMTCDDKVCLPPTDVDFSFTIPATKQAPEVIDVPKKTAPKKSHSSVETPKAPKEAPKKVTPKKKIKTTPKAETKVAAEEAPTPISPTSESATLNPVSWSWSSQKISDTEYDLIFKATIEKTWSVYSQVEVEDGPIPTSFTIENAEAVGIAKEGDNLKVQFDKVFGQKIGKYKDSATFTQRIKVKEGTNPITGYLTYMACDDAQCLPPEDIDFSIDLTGSTTKSSVGAANADCDSPNCGGVFDSTREIDESKAISDCGIETKEKNTSTWWVFVLGFGGGLLALLTPCVFPLIPLTVSFFTKSSKTRAQGIKNAIIYGLSIIVIYVGIGTILTSMFGPTVLNDMATNPWMNVAFFIIFIIFAISFFGAFEITLPSSWANKSDKAADRGGLIGIFFMAFTLALVSFSCTGPIIGSLLVQTVSDASNALFGIIPVKPLVGMFGFSFALALPFALFAMFPAWLNNLPKSGSWMNNVKVTLGFLEVALALKFLSVADMVMHWGILKFELFMVLWILTFLGLGLYHVGLFRFKGEQKKRPGAFRLGLGVLSLAFVAYMSIGLFNYRSMALLSGLAPPVHYNYLRPMDCPHGIDCFKSFDEAITHAQEVNKPLFVDFTGYGCVNCRKMEETVWVKPEIIKHLRENYVVVSLYVDDKKRLFPEDKQKYVLDKSTGRKLRTVGSKWAAFQINNFNRNSQPYYVLMDKDGKTVLNTPVAYTPDEEAYKAFLDCGLDAFNSKHQEMIGMKSE